MKHIKINQDNLYLLLPNKVAQLANRLVENGLASDEVSAIRIVYNSSVYAKLEVEKNKYWWLGLNALYEELVEKL